MLIPPYYTHQWIIRGQNHAVIIIQLLFSRERKKVKSSNFSKEVSKICSWKSSNLRHRSFNNQFWISASEITKDLWHIHYQYILGWDSWEAFGLFSWLKRASRCVIIFLGQCSDWGTNFPPLELHWNCIKRINFRKKSEFLPT